MAVKTTNGNGHNNGNGNVGVGNLSWGNAREIVMIGLILIGGWWGLVYSPINEKFQNFKEADVIMSNKFDAFAQEERKRAADFMSKKEFEKEKKEIDNQIAETSRQLLRIRDLYVTNKEFKLYSESSERRTSILEQNYISRDAFKMWDDKNLQINQLLSERITALSNRINEVEKRLATATTIAPTATNK